MSAESVLDVGGAWASLGLKVGLLTAFFLLAPLVVGYMEHKVMARMQNRLGPMEAGGFHGWAQLIADGAKFLQKESITPSAADRRVFALAPVVVVAPTLAVLAVVPLGPGLWAERLDAGIFFALAASSVTVLGILMAAWASASKFSLIGGMRAAGQLIAYEVPLLLAAAAVVVQAETLSLVGIVEAQAGFELLGLGITVPYVVPHVVGFALFMIAAMAELARPPFDMPIADSEIIAGHMTEYTGMRYAFFMLAEYAGLVVLSALAVVLFLGGWYPWPGVGIPDGPAGQVVGFLVTSAKIGLLAFVMVWLRSTFPRLREDQLQRVSWLVLIPVGLANLVAVSVAKVVAS